MEGVMEGKGEGEELGRAVEIAALRVEIGTPVREGVVGDCEAAAGAPTKGAPASVESGSNPSNLAPKRQTSLFVK
jgi:hypothetical protein